MSIIFDKPGWSVPGTIPSTFFGLHVIWLTQGAGGAGYANAKYPAPDGANTWVNTPLPPINFGSFRIASGALWQTVASARRVYNWSTLDAQLALFVGKSTEILWGSHGFTPGFARTGTLTATAGVAPGSSTLTFASVPSWVNYTTIPGTIIKGVNVTNLTNPGTIQAGTQVVQSSNTSTTLQITNNVLDGGVGGIQSGDIIQFLNVDGLQPPMNYQDLTDFATDMVNHVSATFPNLRMTFEGYNEPVTGGNFFSGTLDELMAEQTAWYAGIKAANPNIVVPSPGFNYAGAAGSPPNVRIADGLAYFLSNTGAGAQGVASKCDTYNFHGYTNNPNPETQYHDANVNSLSFNIPKMKLAINAAGMTGKQIWNSEGGWGTYIGQGANVGTFDYVAFVGRYYLIQLMEGVSRVFWYAYDNYEWGQMWIPGTSYVANATISNGGTGYAVGNIINPVESTPHYSARFFVAAVSGGVVTAIDIVRPGSYTTTTPPATNGSTTALTGTGTGLKLNYTMASVGANGLNPTGVAYGELYKWLVGATKTSQSQGAVLWQINLSRGSYQAQIMWNRNSSTTTYNVPSPYTQMHDLTGAVTTGIQGTNISITGRPIILESSNIF